MAKRKAEALSSQKHKAHKTEMKEENALVKAEACSVRADPFR